jgi:mannose-1-phosphate guanylyltransferase/mannose-6-phosphate isomerase
VAIAALAALKGDAKPDPLLLVLPADHVIEDVAAFHAAIRTAATQAEAGKLVTFGIVARGPETGYGYIRRAGGKGPTYPVAQFIEKPDSKRARQFVESGEYFWNSGMFLFKASRYLAELKRLAPDILEACERASAAARVDLEFMRLPAAEFERCRSESIDYAVMEKTRDAVVVPLDAGWSDVGSWASLHEASHSDAAGNVTRGDVIAEDTHDCYLYADSRLVATVGLGDHVVVETKDAVLVAPKSRVQDVKLLVARLKERQRGEAALHREVFRPWGSYDSLDSGEHFQVKRLTINPGASISLQLHQHRAEHWVVVSGTARITRGEEVFLLEENQSTYIPVGTKHRIENPGQVPVHIIEVQSGAYLGEDDIVRFEDRYGREGTNT